MMKSTKLIAMLTVTVLLIGLLAVAVADDKIYTSSVFSIPKNRIDSEMLELALKLLARLRELVPGPLTERYKRIAADTPEGELLEAVAKSRGFLLPGGALDTERAARIVLDEFRAGKIARVTLDRIPEI